MSSRIASGEGVALAAAPANVGLRAFPSFLFGSVAPGLPLVVAAAFLYRQGAGAGWLAALAVARLAPYLVCSPLAGVVAARFQPKPLFGVLGLARAVAAAVFGLALVFGMPPAVPVIAVFAMSALGTPAYPALMRLLSDAVAPSKLDRITTVAAGLESAAFWAGPALGGILLLAGDGVVVGVTVAMFLAAAASARLVPEVSGLDVDSPPVAALRGALSSLASPGVRAATVSVLGLNVVGGLFTTLLVTLPAELHLGGEAEFGLLSAAHGVGSVLAFVILMWSTRISGRPLLPLVLGGAAVATMALTGVFVVALVATTLLGLAVLAAEVLAANVLARRVALPLVAPAFGLLDALMVAAMVAGSMLAPLVDRVGHRPSLVVTGIAALILAALVRSPSQPPLSVEPTVKETP